MSCTPSSNHLSDDALDLSAVAVNEMTDAMLDGLTDYTSDQRGDVGSWARISCVKGLTSFIQTLFSHANALPDFAAYLPPEKVHDAIAGILKQGVERLDNVRQIAGENFLAILLLPSPAVAEPTPWKVRGEQMMKELFLRYDVLCSFERCPEPKGLAVKKSPWGGTTEHGCSLELCSF